jgi:hypothetical protein
VPWPSWNQAAIFTVLLLVVAAVARRRPTARAARVVLAANETALVAFLYTIWRLARKLPLARDDGAMERGRQIWRLQHTWHLPSEVAVQRWTLHHHWLARACDTFYATAHVPALLVFLVWLYVRHRDEYGMWRNGLVILTAFCLVIRFVRVAPPRFFGDLGFVDTAAQNGLSVYGAVGTGVSDQFAAMPSIHVGWAAVVGFGIVHASTSRWRWLALLHPVLTTYAVVATANHWWLDGIVAVALLGVGLAMDRVGRLALAALRRRRAGPSDGGPELDTDPGVDVDQGRAGPGLVPAGT